MANVQQQYAFKLINPALPPDPDKFIKPRRGLIIVFGFAVGVLAGVLMAFLVHGAKRVRHELAAPAA